MNSKEPYVTIRIPRQLADEIDEIIQTGKLGYKTRAELVKEAIRLRIEQILSRNPISSVRKETDEGLLIGVKETFLAHTIVEMTKGKTLPTDHLNLKQHEQMIRRYITKKAEQECRKTTKEHIDKLTKDLLEYHKILLEVYQDFWQTPYSASTTQ